MNKYLSDEALAQHIAMALNDIDSLPWHRKMVRLRPRDFLLEKLEYVLSKPDDEIETTRIRLFNYLVNKGPERT